MSGDDNGASLCAQQRRQWILEICVAGVGEVDTAVLLVWWGWVVGLRDSAIIDRPLSSSGRCNVDARDAKRDVLAARALRVVPLGCDVETPFLPRASAEGCCLLGVA
eukprot:CAMPEP_0173128456 /NCGR_PEP_ID=MMETSP1102-20130122/58515_1 /TAXON_ID=49646 /ORGANISM="Geminigera sp., Strain Caron Lab Isolate" /LENGTH=106 /DNA_ID=CAMNT_0014038503 /DNA_START=100 /DNA_END=420 /DNA_ORIENTATION=+